MLLQAGIRNDDAADSQFGADARAITPDQSSSTNENEEAQRVALLEKIEAIINQIPEEQPPKFDRRGPVDNLLVVLDFVKMFLHKKNQQMRDLIHSMDALDMALDEQSQARIRARARLNLMNDEHLRQFIGIEDHALANSVVRELRDNASDLLSDYSALTVEQREQAMTRLEQLRQYARTLSTDQNQPEHVRAFAEQVRTGGLHSFRQIRILLNDISQGHEKSEQQLQQGIRAALSQREQRREGRGMSDHASATAEELDALLEIARKELSRHTGVAGVKNLAVFSHGSMGNELLMVESQRKEALTETLRQTSVGRGKSDREIRELVERQISKTPLPAYNILDSDAYKYAMRAGYDAMLRKDLRAAQMHAREVGDLWSLYRGEEHGNAVAQGLSRFAELGVTDAGNSFLRSLGFEGSLRTQEEYASTGQYNKTMMDLLSLAARAPQQAGTAAAIVVKLYDAVAARAVVRGVSRGVEGVLGDNIIGENIGQAVGAVATGISANLGRTAISENYNQDVRDLLREGAANQWLRNAHVNNGNAAEIGGLGSALQTVAGRDNRITLEEVQALLRRANMSTDFLTYDTNRDGLTASELNRAITEAARRMQQRATNEEVASRSAELVAAGWDTNGDGRVTGNEIREAAQRAGVNLARYDVNQDGLEGQELNNALRAINAARRAQAAQRD